MESKINLSETKKVDSEINWKYSEEDLNKLSNYLENANLIKNQLVFNQLLSGAKDCGQVNWLGNITLLIYLIGKLKTNGIVNETISENKFVETHFLKKLEPINNAKQSKGN